ncbi:trypsin-like peptidase domain-containing protein [Pullulanibacillus sp. KACC 23026]|uniref:S1C family serine protease n=1 Tax=Pullulanibacillus sp. KACC 23026 TaxID=3028315 RepID=UPI0023B0BDFA|nr:trypsin-like peptidase domain-containing protein [Pullulanibacillus sp. KACC 23026]WEG12815.1 trypsin-like peptidase domain-containing protein [Pullulanibacillus sp. KACC 23026]
MGYYDNKDYDYEGPERQNRSGRNRRSGWFLSGLLGALVGIVVFFIASPYLARNGLLPSYSSTNQQSAVQSTNTQGTQNTENVSLNLNDSIVQAVDKVSPAVVAVINMQSGSSFMDNSLQEAGVGSGIIYKKDGQYAYVVTNNHVVSGAKKLEVQFDDNTKVTAKLLGVDSLYDLAVLRIPSNKVTTVAQFGNSDTLKRGEPVVAIGNPLGFSGSVTEGIVSANNRTIERTVTTNGGQVQYNAEVIQTDAAINPGNSGGALVNVEGQVIGINSEKIAETDVEGIGFAIPINVASTVIHQLETTGKVERPYMGIGLLDLSQLSSSAYQQLNIPNTVKEGLVISQISSNSPASQAGLQEGDVIVAVNGHKIQDYVDFSTYLYSDLQVGQKVSVDYYRDGVKKTTSLTLGGKTFS